MITDHEAASKLLADVDAVYAAVRHAVATVIGGPRYDLDTEAGFDGLTDAVTDAAFKAMSDFDDREHGVPADPAECAWRHPTTGDPCRLLADHVDTSTDHWIVTPGKTDSRWVNDKGEPA